MEIGTKSLNGVLSFDLECDGFLSELTKIHCICTEDIGTGELNAYYGSERDIYNGLLSLFNAKCIVGHNIIGYDVPAIKKLYPRWKYKSLHDTFLLSCILSPLRSAHSIESYSGGLKVANEDWSCLTYNMLDRCMIDTKVCTSIFKSQYKILSSTSDYDDTVELEYEVAFNHNKQVEARVDVDVPFVKKTIGRLDVELEELSGLVNSRLPLRCVKNGDPYKKVFNKDGTLSHYVLSYFGEKAEPRLWIL